MAVLGDSSLATQQRQFGNSLGDLHYVDGGLGVGFIHTREKVVHAQCFVVDFHSQVFYIYKHSYTSTVFIKSMNILCP